MLIMETYKDVWLKYQKAEIKSEKSKNAENFINDETQFFETFSKCFQFIKIHDSGAFPTPKG